jgi:predicted nuclease of predicted toxin-antitoxin system
MRRFLANENISRTTVDLLRENGHDVKWVAESSPSIDDELVLLLACGEKRIIITFDSDYGDLIYRDKNSPPPGVIYLRVNSDDPALPARLILEHLAISADRFDRSFAVLSETKLRVRSL